MARRFIDAVESQEPAAQGEKLQRKGTIAQTVEDAKKFLGDQEKADGGNPR